MSMDFHNILNRLDALAEGRITPTDVTHGLNAQQRSVDQMPATFHPKSIRVLGAPTDPQHPAKGFFVGGESLEHDEVGKPIQHQPGHWATYFRKQGEQTWNSGTLHTSRDDAERQARQIVANKPDYEFMVKEAEDEPPQQHRAKYNVYPPNPTDIQRGDIHMAYIDRYQNSTHPVFLEFADGAAYRMSHPKDKRWFINAYHSYDRKGKSDTFITMMGNHDGFQKLLRRYNIDQAKELKQNAAQAPRTQASQRRQMDNLKEEPGLPARVQRELEKVRHRYPQATSDTEALLLAMKDDRKQVQTGLDDLEKEIDQAENDLRSELEQRLKSLTGRRGEVTSQVSQLQANTATQKEIINRIIRIDQAQQDALDDLEQTVTNQTSPYSQTARSNLKDISKDQTKVRPKTGQAPPEIEPEFDPEQNGSSAAAGMAQRGLPKPRLATHKGERVASYKPGSGDDLDQDLANTLIDPEKTDSNGTMAPLRRVSEQQRKPQLKRIHYFRVGPGDTDLARESGLVQDRGGNWVLLQYDTSGRIFDQKFTRALGRFGRPVRSDNAEEFREAKDKLPATRNPVAKNVKRSGSGAHRDPRHDARRGETKHPKRDQEQAEVLDENQSSMFVRELRRLYDRNEDQNRHSENALLLAKHFGTREDIQQARAAINFRDRQGGYRMGDAEADQHMANLTRIHRQYYHHLTDSINEGLRPGEHYNYSVTFDDGTTETVAVASDEMDVVRAAVTKKHPGKGITKITSDFAIQNFGGSSPASAYSDRRPTEPFGRDVDNPMVREAWTLRGSKTRDNLEVKVYHDADRGRWALQMFIDGEYRPDQTQHFDNAQEAKEAMKMILTMGLTESKALQGLSEAIDEIEEDMLSRVKHDLTQYLDRLQKQSQDTRSVQKKLPARELGLMVDEDPTAVDTLVTPPPAPMVDPTLPEATVKTVTLEDGCMLEIYGDELKGFGIRREGRELGHRFPKIDHAEMAIELYKARRPQDLSQDYVEER